MKRKTKRYNEGDLVDSYSEYQGFGQMGPRTIQEDINAAAGDNEIRQRRRPPGLTSPYNRPDKDVVEPSTAGFSRTAIKTTEKAPIITKEQMKKAGFDNLRDYMNAQKGLKRREEAKPSGKSMSSFAPDERAARSTNVSYLRKDRFGMEPDMYIARRRMKEGFKSGGKVGSASKRADGIAAKGKTRGRMI